MFRSPPSRASPPKAHAQEGAQRWPTSTLPLSNRRTSACSCSGTYIELAAVRAAVSAALALGMLRSAWWTARERHRS